MDKLTLKFIFTLIFSPQKGWDRIGETTFKKDAPLISLLLPIAGVAAIIAFAQNVSITSKMVDAGLDNAIRLATVAFTKFFATYYIVIYLIPKMLSSQKIDTSKFSIYISYILSITILYYTIAALAPVTMPYLAVTSLYIVYIAYCGSTRYLNITDNRVVNTIVISVSFIIMLLPAVIDILLKILLKM